MTPLPLSLYIHIPWCIKKCPYCDFNSYAHESSSLPERQYIQALIRDFENDQIHIQNRPITSIFFGGGTPSLFSAQSIDTILNEIDKRHPFLNTIEITLEANPGTVEHSPFQDYRNAGITRISLGAQSFQDPKLKALGRVHQARETHKALTAIEKAQFKSFNIDIMYGLPQQSLSDALYDLNTALEYQPPHLSWYQLTLEPNTVFHHQPPNLPPEDDLFEIQNEGLAFLKDKGFNHYEVSAFSRPHFACEHNLNYWRFGDYLGIGAGAHGKITHQNTSSTSSYTIQRYAKTRTPKNYLEAKESFVAKTRTLTLAEIPFEFMLNALRLSEPVSFEMFEARTGLSILSIESMLKHARSKQLISIENNEIHTTPLGKQFLNDLVSLFLP